MNKALIILTTLILTGCLNTATAKSDKRAPSSKQEGNACDSYLELTDHCAGRWCGGGERCFSKPCYAKHIEHSQAKCLVESIKSQPGVSNACDSYLELTDHCANRCHGGISRCYSRPCFEKHIERSEAKCLVEIMKLQSGS